MTGKAGVLQSMGPQRVGLDLANEQQQDECGEATLRKEIRGPGL